MQILVILGEDLAVLTCSSLLPHARRYKVRPAEHLVQQHLEIGTFCIVNRHPDRPVLRQQLSQQLQARPHHGKPPSMFQVVVVVLERGAGVVRRIDVDALHTAGVERQQCLQRLQVVPLDQHVAGLGRSDGQLASPLQQPIGRARGGTSILLSGQPVENRHGVRLPPGTVCRGPALKPHSRTGTLPGSTARHRRSRESYHRAAEPLHVAGI